jgi:hypothetical protein
MKYRIAKESDAKSLALIHIECSKHQQGGFMHRLGFNFLKKYYEITSNNKHSIIILAEDENGEVLGFHSGTLDAVEHYSSLRINRFRFIYPILISLITNPKLVSEIYTRYKYTGNDSKLKFGIKSGVRGEYWGWSPSRSNVVESIKLHRKWHLIIKQLGATSVRSEVDIVNERIYKSIKLMGGIILEEINLHDGRNRALVEYDLTKLNSN